MNSEHFFKSTKMQQQSHSLQMCLDASLSADDERRVCLVIDMMRYRTGVEKQGTNVIVNIFDVYEFETYLAIQIVVNLAEAIPGPQLHLLQKVLSHSLQTRELSEAVLLCCTSPVQHIDFLRCLVEYAELDELDQVGGSALIYACANGHEDIVHLLVKAGADVNLQGLSMLTALMSAVIQKQNVVVQYLLQCCHVDLNLQDCRGRTALHHAVLAHNSQAVMWLLEQSAVVLKDDNELTPLQYEVPCIRTKETLLAYSHKDVKQKTSITADELLNVCSFDDKLILSHSSWCK